MCVCHIGISQEVYVYTFSQLDVVTERELEIRTLVHMLIKMCASQRAVVEKHRDETARSQAT